MYANEQGVVLMCDLSSKQESKVSLLCVTCILLNKQNLILVCDLSSKQISNI